jgi:hypothetical protein
LTQEEIADIVGCAQSTVSRNLARVGNWMKERLTEEAAGEAMAQVETLNHIIAESLAAWEKSKESKKQVVQRVRQARDPESNEQVEVARTTTSHVRESEGNPSYMRTAMNALEDVRDILGIEPPIKIAPTDPSGEHEYQGVSDEALLERIALILSEGESRAADDEAHERDE